MMVFVYERDIVAIQAGQAEQIANERLIEECEQDMDRFFDSLMDDDDDLGDVYDDIENSDTVEDVDVDVCQSCGKYYGPHSKEKDWTGRNWHSYDPLPQRCFKCWDV